MSKFVEGHIQKPCHGSSDLKWTKMCSIQPVSFSVIFQLQTESFGNDWKKLSHLGQKIWKYRLRNTVTVGFNTTVRQMTEMFQWQKCLSKKWPKCLNERKRFESLTRWEPAYGIFVLGFRPKKQQFSVALPTPWLLHRLR